MFNIPVRLWCDEDQGRIEVNSNYWLLQPPPAMHQAVLSNL